MERNVKREKLYKLNEKKRNSIRKLRNNKSISIEERVETQMILSKIPRNSNKVRIKNRCILSGRGRGIYRKFKLSRICIRKLASECKLPGVTKSSW
jgi:small subunit ribosomal protein S14